MPSTEWGCGTGESRRFTSFQEVSDSGYSWPRALAQGADILLLDEAFSGVDLASQTSLMSVLLDLRDDVAR